MVNTGTVGGTYTRSPLASVPALKRATTSSGIGESSAVEM